MDRSRNGTTRAVIVILAIAGLLATAPIASATPRVERVHSAATFVYRDLTVRSFGIDHGELTAVDPTSISLLRQDGVTVTLAASDATTCVRVDGLVATLANLVIGQDIAAVSDETGMAALAIRVGRAHRDDDTPGCRLLRGAVHGDITDQLSDGTTQDRSWDRGRITGLAPYWIRIARADNVSAVSHRTRETRVVHVASYFRLRLGDPVTIVSRKVLDDQGQPRLLALVIRAHHR
ncbi:MAG: hypothetical protein ABI595_13660 [Actinomycetota bacterium]